MSASPQKTFRVATALFGGLLAIQSIWLLLAEFSRPGPYRFPTDLAAASALQNERTSATWAATVGAIRGDLWAEAAFTYGNLMWDDSKPEADAKQARSILDRTLRAAPHQFGAWLLLAGLASRYSLPGVDVPDALRMSYYTGPSEFELVPLRFRIALAARAFEDIELRQSMQRDVRLLLKRSNTSMIADIYSGATAPAKQFIEQAIADVDPSALGSLKGAAQPQPN